MTTTTILFLLANHVSSQNKTYFGMEAAITNDIYKIEDNGSNLKTVTIISGLWGFTIRQDINSYLFSETGLIKKYYYEGFGFKNYTLYSTTNAIDAWLIPFRLGGKINLFKEKIYIVPVVGYSFCINSDYGSNGFGSGWVRTSRDSVLYHYSDNTSLTRNFSLLQTGLGIEFKVLKSVILSISVNHYTGFKKVVQLDINYTTNNSPPMTGEAYSKGEFWSVGVGLKYPISNFWKKKS